jgi:hypothetical protein
MGLDANFSETIEDSPIFPEVLQYLSDGVGYWKEKGHHHPFLHPSYGKGGGYRYHSQFSKIGLPPAYAEKVSFVELLSCPTCGKTAQKRLMELIDIGHLKRLDSIIGSPKQKKSVFIARGAYSCLFEIGRTCDCFFWLPEPRRFELNTLYTMDIHEALRVHVITHFSDSISDSHLAAIRAVIMT